MAEDVVGKVRDVKSFEAFEAMADREDYILDSGSGVYTNLITYPEYEVKIEIASGPVAALNKAIITVETDTDVGIQGSSFTTEMYFDEVVVITP